MYRPKTYSRHSWDEDEDASRNVRKIVDATQRLSALTMHASANEGGFFGLLSLISSRENEMIVLQPDSFSNPRL